MKIVYFIQYLVRRWLGTYKTLICARIKLLNIEVGDSFKERVEFGYWITLSFLQ